MTRRRTPTVVSAVDAAFRAEWSGLVATLRREFGDLQIAEDAAQDAFAAASRMWRRDGVPERPGAWLLVTARRRAIDALRRAKSLDDRLATLADAPPPSPREMLDDQLALIFGCCHPALSTEAQVALTLRTVCGLSTDQIARAFLVPSATMGKRLVRAKDKIRRAGIPFSVPDVNLLDERVDGVAAVIYAVFTEGHASTGNDTLIRGDLCDEAIWLAETVTTLLPDHGDVHALAALCLLTDARRAARFGQHGEPILLPDQDRDAWDRHKVARGLDHLVAARRHDARGPYRPHAEIAAVHSISPCYDATDWTAIIGVYDRWLAAGGNAVVALNRAVALGERDGPDAALAALTPLLASGELDDYHYAHVAHATSLRRAGRNDEAVAAYDRALATCSNDSEARWIRAERAEVATSGRTPAGHSSPPADT
ncbi:MAG: sigma-70 family RNA polymerase sigma factor [Actinomycetota bacterium]